MSRLFICSYYPFSEQQSQFVQKEDEIKQELTKL